MNRGETDDFIVEDMEALRAAIEAFKGWGEYIGINQRHYFMAKAIRAYLDARRTPIAAGSGEATEEARALLNAFSIYTVEDDEGIRLSTGGHVVAHYGNHSPEGIAMLKLEALCRDLRSSLSRKTAPVEAEK